MRLRALDLISCPGCGGDLVLASGTPELDGHVLEGELECRSCKLVRPITRGVPRLATEVLPIANATAERFADEWKMYDVIADRYRDQFLDWVDPLTPVDFKAKVVLEGGCGKGRHTRLIAGFGAAEVVAVDLGDAVEVAFGNTRDIGNVHVVQTDLLRPAVQPVFDLAVCVGVLHHLADPEAGFRALVGALRPGGRVATWTYGLENNQWIVKLVNPIRTAITSKLPPAVLLMLSSPLAVAVFLAARIAARTGGRWVPYASYLSYIAAFPFSEVRHIVYDQLTPPISYYLPREAIEEWYAHADLREIQLSWHNRNSWRATGVKQT